MQRIITIFEARPWLRAGILLAILLPVAWVVLPHEGRLVMAYYSPLVGVPLLLGAIVGWLTYNKKWFFIVAATSFVIFLVLSTIGRMMVQG